MNYGPYLQVKGGSLGKCLKVSRAGLDVLMSYGRDCRHHGFVKFDPKIPPLLRAQLSYCVVQGSLQTLEIRQWTDDIDRQRVNF